MDGNLGNARKKTVYFLRGVPLVPLVDHILVFVPHRIFSRNEEDLHC